MEDLDQDGDPDVLASAEDGVLVWYENSAGVFLSAITITDQADHILDVWAGDLDSDGLPDILCTTQTDFELALFRGTGGGAFADPEFLYTEATLIRFAVVDLDDDSDLDIVAEDGVFDRIIWFENDGAGSFSPAIEIMDGIVDPIRLTTADFNADGLPDLVFGLEAADDLVWMRNLGAGLFAPTQLIDNDVNGLRNIEVGDIDGDGDSDVLYVSSIDGELLWRANDGSGIFGPSNVIQDGLDGGGFAHLTDFDNDGAPDVFWAYTESFGNYSVSLRENDGAGNFSAPEFIEPGIPAVVEATSADLDNDGDQDLVVNYYFENDVVWYENRLPIASSVEEQNWLDWTLAPNPATEYLQLNWLNQRQLDWEISDMAGRILQSGTVFGNSLRLDVSDLLPAVYLITLQQEQNKIEISVVVE